MESASGHDLRHPAGGKIHPLSANLAGHAFTLIELLVVIGLVGVLIALSVPALRVARARAFDTVSLANLRSIHGVVETYADRYKGQYPVAQEGVNYRNGCAGIQSGFLRWATTYAWPAVIHEVLTWDEGLAFFLSPRARRDSLAANSPFSPTCGWPTSYYFSQAFLARPELWARNPAAGTDSDIKNWLRSVYQGDVQFPSKKVMFWDYEMPYLGRRLRMDSEGNLEEASPTLFADGHAQQRIQSNASKAIPTTTWHTNFPVQRWHNTQDGVRGFDE
ncbi:MAG: type II secretion system protein [Phycisphaerae bacterium]|nr:type II secretion system protein [Phycisphaerae bacterium]